MCRLLLGMGLGLIGNARLRDGRSWRQVSILIDNLLSPILTDWILIEYPVERWKTQNSSYKCRGRIREDTGGLRGTRLAAIFVPHKKRTAGKIVDNILCTVATLEETVIP